MRQVALTFLAPLLLGIGNPHYDQVTGTTSNPFYANNSETACGGGHYDDGLGTCVPVMTFDLPPAVASAAAAALPRSLILNGATETPEVAYVADDISGATWTAEIGDNLSEAGAGASPSSGTATPLGSETAVTYNGAKFHQAAGSSTGDITTGDFVLELVFKTPATTPGALEIWVDKRLSGAGWALQFDTLARLQLVINDGSGSGAPQSNTLDDDTWYHAICYVDRSGNAQWYVNGAASGSPATVSTAPGSLSSAVLFSVGARSNDTFNSTGTIVHLSLTEGSATWLDTPLQATSALGRAAQGMGVYPQIAQGRPEPTSMNRPSQAELLNGSSYYLVGDGWMRTNAAGFTSEVPRTNSVLQSDDLSTSWTPTRATIGVDGDTGPMGATMDSINGTAVENTHLVSQAVTLTATVWTFSAWVTAGNLDFASLQDSTVAHRADFQISTCSASGTTVAVIDTFADVVGGECRIGMSFTATAAAHTMELYSCEADNDCSYTGDATADAFFGGIQVELGRYPTSLIATTTTPVTRSEDRLLFKADDGNIGGIGSGRIGTLEVVTTQRDYDSPLLAYFATLTDGASVNERIAFVGDHTGGVPALVITESGATQCDISGTTDLHDDTEKTIRYSWATDSNGCEIYVGGAQEAQDTSVGAIPDDLDRLSIGARAGVSQGQPVGPISRLRIWPKRVIP